MFKLRTKYSASDITSGVYQGIYDSYIAMVDGRLEHLTDWIDEVYSEYKEEEDYKNMEDSEVYELAIEEVIYNIPVAYEDAKKILVFKGIPPASKHGFDVYTTYELIAKHNLGRN